MGFIQLLNEKLSHGSLQETRSLAAAAEFVFQTGGPIKILGPMSRRTSAFAFSVPVVPRMTGHQTMSK